MARSRHIPWPGILMVGSLLLLAGFEVIWLQSAYHREQELLEERQTQRLHGIVRDLEDSLIQTTLLAPQSAGFDSLDHVKTHFRLVKNETGADSTKVIAMMHSLSDEQHDTLRFRQRHMRKGAMVLGGLLRHISFTGDSSAVAQSLRQMLESKLHEPPMDALDRQYHLISWSDSLPANDQMVSRPFYDIFSGNHYAISFPGYRAYLFRQMIPQLSFALFLFACISGAFFVISRNLVRQRRLAIVRSNLISNITHELKTPIATVGVALEALRNFQADADETRRQEYLGIAQSEINRLSLLVDKVLKTSHAEHGQTELKVELLNFKDLINEVLDTLKVQFGKISAQVNFTSQGDDFDLEGDKIHLSGVVHNLVDNAMKYGGTAPRIDMHISQQNGTITLLVTDHGIGIPKGYRERIFEKFFRVPSGDVHNTKGHGLGLSYVSQVVREHSGTITVESEEGVGSTFAITLPKHHAD